MTIISHAIKNCHKINAKVYTKVNHDQFYILLFTAIDEINITIANQKNYCLLYYYFIVCKNT